MKKCPICNNELKKLYYPSNSYLNKDQWESQRAGDYYCTHCTPNNRSESNKYAYFWESEINI